MSNLGGWNSRHRLSLVKIVFIIGWVSVCVFLWIQFSSDPRVWVTSGGELRTLFLLKMLVITFPTGPVVLMAVYYVTGILGVPDLVDWELEYFMTWLLLSGLGLFQWVVLCPRLVTLVVRLIRKEKHNESKRSE